MEVAFKAGLTVPFSCTSLIRASVFYGLFTLRKAQSPLEINGGRAFLRVNRLYLSNFTEMNYILK